MATQLKHTDFSYPTAPPHRPNVRVVFSAGAATLAMREATAKLPEATKSATLDELAARPFRDLLILRNAVSARINEERLRDDETEDSAFAELTRLEGAIINGQALTPDDAVAKMVVLLQLSLEGSEVGDALALRALHEAQRHFGLGRVDETTMAFLGEANVAASLPVAVYDYGRWDEIYATYVSASAERLTFENGPLEKAASLFKAVRSAWPATYEFNRDPAAAAAIKAVDYEDIQNAYDTLVFAEGDALSELMEYPAESHRQLATKLRLFHENEAHTYTDAGAISAALAADAARLDKYDAMKDAILMAGFAARCREFIENQDKAMSPAEDEAYWERVDAAEKPLHDNSATTIEGVVAKLRLTFPHLTSEAYADYALGDPASAVFRKGLAMDGMYIRLLWSAIEDLARIGGVSMSEKAA